LAKLKRIFATTKTNMIACHYLPPDVSISHHNNNNHCYIFPSTCAFLKQSENKHRSQKTRKHWLACAKNGDTPQLKAVFTG